MKSFFMINLIPLFTCPFLHDVMIEFDKFLLHINHINFSEYCKVYLQENVKWKWLTPYIPNKILKNIQKRSILSFFVNRFHDSTF